MPRFILIDPWLADVGGHNFQYALDVLQSAEEQGYEPVLAVNRSLPASTRMPRSWNRLRLFRYGMCSHYWLGPDGRCPHPFDLDGKWLRDGDRPGLVARLKDGLARLDRRRRILDFARGCRELFEGIQPTKDDLLFLPSMSESDLVGCVRFLRDNPRTAAFTWHLQFHFNIFSGRDPEFSKQSDGLRRLQRHFQTALNQVPDHRIKFYATTDPMARQFDHIGIAKFTTLPYPVRDLAGAAGAESRPVRGARRPLRVTFAGAMRREKGKKQFGSLIAAVWDDCLASRKMEFVFQARPRQVVGWIARELRNQITVAPIETTDGEVHLRTVRHPLDAQAYHQFIRQTDIGLFLYDSRRYFARASGIMGEMLAAGTPVIVPAGCWLADQIQPPMYRHVESLRQEFAMESQFLSWKPGVAEQTVCYQLPFGASDLAIQFACPTEMEPGRFFQLSAQFDGNDGKSSQLERAILGPIRDGEVVVAAESTPDIGCVFRIPPGSTHVQLGIAWAYLGGPAPVDVIRVTTLKRPTNHEHHPRSRVGVIASTESDVPDLLREMAEHYEHYRNSARLFSAQWLAEHHPRRTIEILNETAKVPSRGAELAEVG
jgi:hypothetical protein